MSTRHRIAQSHGKGAVLARAADSFRGAPDFCGAIAGEVFPAMKTTASTAKGRIPSRWNWHYRELMRVRDRIVHAQDEHQSALRELSGNARDACDAASNETEHEELLAELSLEGIELTEIDAALERIRTGRYGICAVTGKPIPPARLRAVPWARTVTAPARAAWPDG